MKFLVDNALSRIVSDALKIAGHDAVHVRDYQMQSSTDEEIFEVAAAEYRVLISADTDFGTIIASRRTNKPSFILFRGSVTRIPLQQATLLLDNLSSIEESLEAGSIVIFDEDRLRIRSLPILP